MEQLRYSQPGLFSVYEQGDHLGCPFSVILTNRLALWLNRSGSNMASLTRTEISEPENLTNYKYTPRSARRRAPAAPPIVR